MNAERALTNWNTYQAAWADISADERQSMIAASISPDVVYTDPTSISHGYNELTAKMEDTQQRFPGATFHNDKFVSHHDQAVSHWTMNDLSGQPIFVGVSTARFDDDDRLASMTGFFEPAA